MTSRPSRWRAPVGCSNVLARRSRREWRLPLEHFRLQHPARGGLRDACGGSSRQQALRRHPPRLVVVAMRDSAAAHIASTYSTPAPTSAGAELGYPWAQVVVRPVMRQRSEYVPLYDFESRGGASSSRQNAAQSRRLPDPAPIDYKTSTSPAIGCRAAEELLTVESSAIQIGRRQYEKRDRGRGPFRSRSSDRR